MHDQRERCSPSSSGQGGLGFGDDPTNSTMSDRTAVVPVLVTGASGFIATHLVAQLLERGYDVRGTVREPDKARNQGYPTSLAGAERLELVAADLLT